MPIDASSIASDSPLRRHRLTKLCLLLMLIALSFFAKAASANDSAHRSLPVRLGSEFGLGFAGNTVGVLTGTQLLRYYYSESSTPSEAIAYIGGGAMIASPFLAATGSYYGGKLTGGHTKFVYPFMGATLGSGLAYLPCVIENQDVWSSTSLSLHLSLPPLMSSIFYEVFDEDRDYSLLGASFLGLLGGPGLGFALVMGLPGEAELFSIITGVLMTPVSVYFGGRFTGGHGTFAGTFKGAGIGLGIGILALPFLWRESEIFAYVAGIAFFAGSLLGYELSNHKKSGKDKGDTPLDIDTQPVILQLLSTTF